MAQVEGGCTFSGSRFSLNVLLSRQVLDGEQVEALSKLAGVEECKASTEDGALSLHNDQLGDKRDQAILYVTVHSHSGGDSKVVPFRFSSTGNVAQVRAQDRPHDASLVVENNA